MPRSRAPYPLAFRQWMVDLVRSGPMPESPAARYEPLVESIRNWFKQAARDEGKAQDGLTTNYPEELPRLRRENHLLREERGNPGKGRGLVRRGDRLDTSRTFEFVKAHRAKHSVATMCRLLEVSERGYYAWLDRAPSARSVG